MTKHTTLAAFAVSLLAASAEARNPRWHQARHAMPAATLVDREIEGRMAIGGAIPKPTPAPMVKKNMIEVDERLVTLNGPDTCGYLSGVETASLYCDPQSICVKDEEASAVGCCPESNTDCNVWTTCLNSDQKAQFTTDNGLTMWCGFADFPSCVKHVYAPGDLLTGYTIYGCGKSEGLDVINYFPTGQPKVTYSYDLPTNHVTASSSKNTNGADEGDEESSGGSNTAAIVGGAVGGAAGLAVIGATIFFIMRKRKAKKAAALPTAAAAVATAGGSSSDDKKGPDVGSTTYPPTSPMSQQQHMSAPYTPGSPPPAGSHIPSMYSSPGTEYAQNAGYQGQYSSHSPQPHGAPYPAPSYGWGQQPAVSPPPGQQNFVAELPTEKNDNKPVELA